MGTRLRGNPRASQWEHGAHAVAYTAKVAVLLALVLAAVAVAALVTKRPMTVALVLLSVAIVLMTFDLSLIHI